MRSSVEIVVEIAFNLNVEGLSAAKLNFLSFLAMHYMEKTSNEKEKTLLSNMTSTILVFL